MDSECLAANESSMKTISPYYIMGIQEGREALTKYGMSIAQDELDNLESTIKRGFDASSPVGQMLRGERDFWKNQIKVNNHAT